MLHVTLLMALMPLSAALLLWAARDPLRRLLPLYAASVPFGSGLAIPGLPATYFSVSSIAGFLLTLILLGRLATRERGPDHVPASVVAWLLFAAVAGSTIYWTIDPLETTSDFIALCSVVALYVAIRLSAMDSLILRRMEKWIVFGGAIAAVYGFYQYYTGTLMAGASGSLRFGRDLTDPNHVAAGLLLPLSLALSRSSTAPAARSRFGYGAAAAAVLVAVLLTGSRGGVLGAIAVFVVLAVNGPHRARLVTGVAGAVCALGMLLLLVPGAINQRLTEEGSSGRTGVWQVGLAGCPEYCLAGSGWATFGLVYEEYLPGTPEAGTLRGRQMGSHNNFLRVLVEAGVAGLLTFSAGLFLVLREAVRLPSEVRGPPLAAVVGLLLTGMLLGNMQFKYFWLVLIYVGAAHRVNVCERQRQRRPDERPIAPTS